MLDTDYEDSRSIMIGSMFFPAFLANYNQYGFNGVSVSLRVNENALNATYLGSDVLAQGENPFSITPLTMTAAIENDGLPTFNVTVEGIDFDTPYFYLDFSNSYTVAWGINCTHSKILSYPAGGCST